MFGRCFAVLDSQFSQVSVKPITEVEIARSGSEADAFVDCPRLISESIVHRRFAEGRRSGQESEVTVERSTTNVRPAASIFSSKRFPDL